MREENWNKWNKDRPEFNSSLDGNREFSRDGQP